ncbi:hypothetical protein NDU88_003894 [Pleurodeles waltl]|uniref:Uncharacterized protein n=1 Tax=Pleurodeles waltl TaxID=8319 RepID=A0AAV7T6X0_PLEWA|nr:hypothetical protein NDU88_003894 [Pleurodeles waltl]
MSLSSPVCTTAVGARGRGSSGNVTGAGTARASLAATEGLPIILHVPYFGAASVPQIVSCFIWTAINFLVRVIAPCISTTRSPPGSARGIACGGLQAQLERCPDFISPRQGSTHRHRIGPKLHPSHLPRAAYVITGGRISSGTAQYRPQIESPLGMSVSQAHFVDRNDSVFLKLKIVSR